MDFGFCFLLLTYGHGESKASHSLIKQQQGGCPIRLAQGAMDTETNPHAPRKRSGRCRTHLLPVGLKVGQAGHMNGFDIYCFW